MALPGKGASKSKYQRIYDDLLSLVGNGSYAIGCSIPTERALAVRYEVSVATVRQALSLLERQGLISREQGRGTIVRRKEPVLNSPTANRRKGLAYVLIEPEHHPGSTTPSVYERSQNEMRCLDRAISARDSHILFSQTTSRRLAEGHLPKVLDADFSSGVFLSGSVSDVDVYLLREKGLPVVVMGSQPVTLKANRVECDIEEAAYLVTESLSRHAPDDVLFVSEPFMLESTHRAFAGYCRAVQGMGKTSTCRVLSGAGEDTVEMRLAISGLASGSAVVLVNVSVFALMEVYRDLGLDISRQLLAVIGASGAVPDHAKRQLNICSDGSPVLCEAAVRLMDYAITTGRTRTQVLKPKLETSTEEGRLALELSWEDEPEQLDEEKAEAPLLHSSQAWWLAKPSNNP